MTNNSFFMRYRRFGHQRTLVKYYFIVLPVFCLAFLVYTVAVGGYSADFSRPNAQRWVVILLRLTSSTVHCANRGFLFVLAGLGILYIAQAIILVLLRHQDNSCDGLAVEGCPGGMPSYSHCNPCKGFSIKAEYKLLLPPWVFFLVGYQVAVILIPDNSGLALTSGAALFIGFNLRFSLHGQISVFFLALYCRFTSHTNNLEERSQCRMLNQRQRI